MRVVVHNLYGQQVQAAFSTLPAFAKGHLPAQSSLCPSHQRLLCRPVLNWLALDS